MELLGRQFGTNFGMAIVYARLFPQVGLGQSAELAIQSFCRQVAFAEEGLQPPRIMVGNLSTQRDYSDVEETAIALAHLGFRGAAGEVYNMASGRAHRMAGILQMIIDQAKTRIAVEVDPKRIRPADESLLLGDTRKVREALGWHPIMDLRRAIRRILEYWRKHASRAAAARSIMIEPLRRNKAAGEMNGGSIPRTSRQLVDNGAINDTRAGARLCKTAQIVPLRWTRVMPGETAASVHEKEAKDRHFHPSIIRLPPGSTMPYLAVARRKPRPQFSTDREKVTISSVELFRCQTRQVLSPSIPWKAIDDAKSRFSSLKTERLRKSTSYYGHYVGVEDPRLVWHATSWQVLLIYGMNSERSNKLGRDLWLVDVATLFPPLLLVLPQRPAANLFATKLFSTPTELMFSGAVPPIEKNWAPFMNRGRLLLSYSLAPERVVLNVSADGFASIDGGGSGPAAKARTAWVTGRGNKDGGEASLFTDCALLKRTCTQRHRVNHGSNAVLVRFCRGSVEECGRTVDRDRYVIIWHTQPQYENFMATFYPYPPYAVDAVFPLRQLDGCTARHTGTRKLPNGVAHIYFSSLEVVNSSTYATPYGPSAALAEATALIGVGVNDARSWLIYQPLARLVASHPLLLMHQASTPHNVPVSV